MGIKLGKRLAAIESLIVHDYDHIWDGCCDHGFLGCSLLGTQPASQVHFVDIVPELMAELEEKLNFHQKKNRPCHWSVHCLDVACLPLQAYEGRHLVILAGVGGDLMCHFVQQICQQHPQLQIDFILCPVHRQYQVRQTLIELDFRLSSEILVKENKRYYELLLVSFNVQNGKDSRRVNMVGEDIWKTTTEAESKIAREYLDNTIAHYRRIQKSGEEIAAREIHSYLKLLKRLNNGNTIHNK